MDSDTTLWRTDDALLGFDFPLPLDRAFTVRDASRAGVGERRLADLHRRGYVRRVLRGVYAAQQAPDTMRFRAHAVSLVIPPRAIVTDRTAAWLHGVSILPRTSREEPPPIEVFRTDDTRVRRPGVHGGCRQLLARDIIEVGEVRVTTPLRTALDLGRSLWRFDALAALDGFARIGVSVEEMVAESKRFRGFRGVRQLRPLLAITDGRAESPGESALRLHWYEAGLPKPTLQHRILNDEGVEIFRIDLSLPELRYAGEYDGLDHHSSTEDRSHDEWRRGWLEDEGWTIDALRKENVYGFRADAGDVLRAGVVRARQALPTWTP